MTGPITARFKRPEVAAAVPNMTVPLRKRGPWSPRPAPFRPSLPVHDEVSA